MITCNSCGAENTDEAKFCVRCGAAVTGAATPGAWRDASGDLGTPMTEEAGSSSSAPGGTYTPPYAPPPPPTVGNYPGPPAPYNSYGQQQPQSSTPFQSTTREPMHPALPAVASLFFPGLGLLFVPNKAGLGIAIFAGLVVFWTVAFIFLIGFCLVIIAPLINVLAAVHSWDEAAKASDGKFQPLLFKS